jgi:hypothetical protein
MGCAGLFALARPRRKHAKLAIDLHGIGIDEGAAKAASKLEGRSRFAARSWACDQDGLHRHGISLYL